jgi:hypothetical protein
MEAMEKEHRSKSKFLTPNYGISTSPADEWRIVTECDLSFEKEHNGQRRRIPSYAKLLKADQSKAEGQRAGLTQEEIIAVILYTGPMVRQRERDRQRDRETERQRERDRVCV